MHVFEQFFHSLKPLHSAIPPQTFYNETGERNTTALNLEPTLKTWNNSWNESVFEYSNVTETFGHEKSFLNYWWALLASMLVIFTAFGNVLVCLAISLERRLQNVTNYFLMSLAITDLCVAVLVMPLGILTLMKGYFPLRAGFCLMWICLDVFLCTASIMHLCTISVDRYLSLRYPMRFGRNKTRKRVTVKIAFVWVCSTAMSVPLLMYYKVALIFGIMGACRRQELHDLQFSDVQILDNTILVTVRNTKTKKDRAFTVTGSYCDLCKKYLELRPKTCTTSSFFIKYKTGKCNNQNIGINWFGALGKSIAIYLNLPNPEMYTGHCFRRTSATLLVDAGGDITTLKRHGGWKSTTVAEGYIDESRTQKVNVSNQIMNAIQKKEIININLPSTSTSNSNNVLPSPSPSALNVTHCTNVNINYYYSNK